MKLYKTTIGWKCIETNEIIPFGAICLDFYNFYQKKKKELNKQTLSLIEQGKTFKDFEMKELEKKYQGIDDSSEESQNLNILLDIIDYKILEINQEYFTLSNRPEYLKKAQDQGCIITDNSINITLIDYYLMKVFESLDICVSNHFIDGKWSIVYDTDKIDQTIFVFLDLQEMHSSKFKFIRCPHCQKIFIKKPNERRKKYCSSQCQLEVKKMYDKKNSESVLGYNRKTINYLRNTLEFSECEIYEYKIESEKKSEELSSEDYLNWLEQKRNYFKSIKKSIKN